MVNSLTREMLLRLFKRCYKLSLRRNMLLYSRAGFEFSIKKLVLGVLEPLNTLPSEHNKLS